MESVMMTTMSRTASLTGMIAVWNGTLMILDAQIVHATSYSQKSFPIKIPLKRKG